MTRLRVQMSGQADAKRLQEVLAPYRGGEVTVVACYKNSRASCEVSLGENWRIRLSLKLLRELRIWLGSENVQILSGAAKKTPDVESPVEFSDSRGRALPVATSKNVISVRNSNGVNYFVDYHKVNVRGEKNPKFTEDRASHVILDLKKDTNRNYKNAVQQVSNLIGPRLKDVVKANAPYSLAVIPSSEAGKWSPGLEAFVEATCKTNKNFTAAPRVLKRHTKIEKLAKGGPRGVDVHLASVNVQKPADVKGKRILLIDDVTTTGNSFAACKKLLENAGAVEVICVAIAKTADD